MAPRTQDEINTNLLSARQGINREELRGIFGHQRYDRLAAIKKRCEASQRVPDQSQHHAVMSTENHGYEEVEIRTVDYGSVDAAPLIEAATTDLATRYRAQLADLGGPNTIGLQNEPSKFESPQGGFFLAFLNRRAVGCGGWVSYGTSGEVAELKKLYVIPEARKHGIARRLLAASESSARERGQLRMILEVGTSQPEALALYERCGYKIIENYGYFRDIPECRCYARKL